VNGSVNTFPRQPLRKWCFLLGRAKEFKARQLGQTSQFFTGVFGEKCQLGSSHHSEKTSEPEAEESPLLEAVTRERLMKTQQAAKYLAYAVMICKFWRLDMALQLLLVPSCVYKLSINPISN
jgi:hypothetical protein